MITIETILMTKMGAMEQMLNVRVRNITTRQTVKVLRAARFVPTKF